MKANELMPGDWVKLKNNHCKSIQLTAIDETYNSINYFDGDAERELTLQLTAIEPIPITPEILEKNGFEWNIYHTSQDLVCGTIHLGYGFYKNCISAADWDENGKVQIVSLECKYVHEFQRVLRCVGLYELANSIKL